MRKEKLINKVELPSIPLYDGNESIIDYGRRFNEYLDALEKIKYDAILNFLNTWLSKYEIKLKRIIDFKNFERSIILSKKKYNKSILKKYSTELYQFLNINEETFENCDSDDIGEEDIIVFLKRILFKINYSIYKREKDDQIFYTIYNRKKID